MKFEYSRSVFTEVLHIWLVPFEKQVRLYKYL